MPASGHVADLVTGEVGVIREAVVDGAAHGFFWVSGSGPWRKRIRLNRKPLHTSRV